MLSGYDPAEFNEGERIQILATSCELTAEFRQTGGLRRCGANFYCRKTAGAK